VRLRRGNLPVRARAVCRRALARSGELRAGDGDRHRVHGRAGRARVRGNARRRRRGLLVLAAPSLLRLVGSFEDMRADFTTPTRCFRFLAVVAGSAVLGERLYDARFETAALVLLAVTALGWLVLGYAVPAVVMLGSAKPGLAVAADGTRLLWVVATESISTAAAQVADHPEVPTGWPPGPASPRGRSGSPTGSSWGRPRSPSWPAAACSGWTRHSIRDRRLDPGGRRAVPDPLGVRYVDDRLRVVASRAPPRPTDLHARAMGDRVPPRDVHHGDRRVRRRDEAGPLNALAGVVHWAALGSWLVVFAALLATLAGAMARARRHRRRPWLARTLCIRTYSLVNLTARKPRGVSANSRGYATHGRCRQAGAESNVADPGGRA